MSFSPVDQFLGFDLSFENSLKLYDITYKVTRGDGQWHEYQSETATHAITNTVQDAVVSEGISGIFNWVLHGASFHPVPFAARTITEFGIARIRDLFDEQKERNYQHELYLNCAKTTFRAVNALVDDVHNSTYPESTKTQKYQEIITKVNEQLKKYEKKNPAIAEGLTLGLQNVKKMQEVAKGQIRKEDVETVVRSFKKGFSLLMKLPETKGTPEAKAARQSIKKALGMPAKSTEETEQLPDQFVAQFGALGSQLQAMTNDVQTFQRYIAEQKERERIETRERNITLGFSFLQGIGEITGSRGIQRAAIVGQSTYKIMSQIRTISTLAKVGQVGATTLLGPFAAIGLAGLSIMGLFKKKKSDGDQMLSRHLQLLSQQMGQLRSEIQQHFQETYKNQKLIFDAVTKGLSFVHYTVKTDIRQLHVLTISRLDDIESHLQLVHNAVQDRFNELALTPLKAAISRIEREQEKHARSNSVTISSQDAEALKNTLEDWLIDTRSTLCRSKNAHLTGSWMVLQPESYAKYTTLNSFLDVDLLPLGEVLGVLSSFSQSKVTAVNVAIWAQALVAYRTLSQLTNRGIDQHNVSKIVKDGQEVLDLMATFREKRVQIFKEFFEQYLAAFQVFKKQIEEKGINKSLQNDLHHIAARPAPFQNLLQKAAVEMHGQSFSLKSAEPGDVQLPPLLELAQEKRIGRFKFIADAARIPNNGVVKNSFMVFMHMPSAKYTVRCMFACGEKEFPIAYTEATSGGGSQQFISKHGKDRDKTESAWRASYNSALAQPIGDFLHAHWNPEKMGLRFTSRMDEISEEDQKELMTKVLEQYKDPNNQFLLEAMNREDVRMPLAKLTAFRSLALAFAQLIQDTATFSLVQELPSGKWPTELLGLDESVVKDLASKIQTSLSNTVTESSALEVLVTKSMLYLSGEIDENPLGDVLKTV